LFVAAGLLALLTGCMGAQFGSELSAKPKPRALRSTQSATVHLPQDEAFAIVLPSAHKKAGLDGTAESDADAKPAGAAEASASVKTAGTAEGLFQLGHALSNETDRQMDVAFTVRVHYEFEARNQPAERLPDAAVGLRLYAREPRGRLLRDLVLVDATTESGTAQRHGDETLNFTLTLGPGDTVHVFLAGQAKVDISTGRSASSSLKVSHLEFDVVTQPAPPVQ
jgi:hypothetical protein